MLFRHPYFVWFPSSGLRISSLIGYPLRCIEEYLGVLDGEPSVFHLYMGLWISNDTYHVCG